MPQLENWTGTSPNLTPLQAELSRAFLIHGIKAMNVDKILANQQASSTESIITQ
jgi:hypothetical protein